MRYHGNQAMGPSKALHTPGWIEVSLPYMENRNEEEVAIDPNYRGPMPSWEIWDWLEAVVSNMHDDVDGEVAWWRTTGEFQFFFKKRHHAALFVLRFNGELLLL